MPRYCHVLYVIFSGGAWIPIWFVYKGIAEMVHHDFLDDE